jgi:hypothetical protein
MPEETDPVARTLAGVKTIYQQVAELKGLLGHYYQDPEVANAQNRPTPFAVYRANRDMEKGVALRIEPKADDRGRCLFAEIASQKTPLGKGKATFNWDEAVRVSLGRSDVSQIAAYLDKRLPNNNEKFGCYELYHDSSMYAGKKQNTIVSVGWTSQSTLRIQISRQVDGHCMRKAIVLAAHEAFELELLLCDWLVSRCNWLGRKGIGGVDD